MQSSRLRAEIQVRSHVVVPRNRKSVKIEALALLHNDSDDHFVLGAVDSASTRGWQLLDANGKEVARHVAGKPKTPRGATDPFTSSMVPSNHSIRESETVEVDASKLKHGARYTLRHNHWGYIGEAEFVVVHEPERVAAAKKASKRKAKKAKRKVAKKPAAPKKKAAKKAKRKVAKKPAAPKKKVTKKAKRKPAAKKKAAAKKTSDRR